MTRDEFLKIMKKMDGIDESGKPKATVQLSYKLNNNEYKRAVTTIAPLTFYGKPGYDDLIIIGLNFHPLKNDDYIKFGELVIDSHGESNNIKLLLTMRDNATRKITMTIPLDTAILTHEAPTIAMTGRISKSQCKIIA